MNGPPPSSADIELHPVLLSSPSPKASLPPTAKSSNLTLPLSPSPSQPVAGFGNSLSRTDSIDPLNTQSLHPVDGGYHAWMFLVGATTIEVLIWGLPFSIGVLHLYWTNTLFSGYGAATITLASTLHAGLLYMLTAIAGPLITAFPRYTKKMQLAGVVVSTLGTVTSGLVTEPWQLVITFGVLYPFAAVTYLPCATILFEWFSARRGLAGGIMFAGTGVGGTFFPFLITGLIGRFGYKAAMISLGIGYGVLCSIALIPIKRRLPLPRRRGGAIGDEAIRRPKANMEFLKHRLVWIGCGVIMLSSLGNFVPSLWLPTFADDLHVYPSGTGLISIMNAASVPGNAIIGYLSDRWPIRILIAVDCLATAMACFFLWGFGTNASLLVPFSLVFGVLGVGFISVQTKMMSMIAKDDPTVPAMAFSIFAFARGVGSMASGPIADQLLKVDILKGGPGAYGVHNYGILLIFTGSAILCAGIMGLLFREGRRPVMGPVS